MNLIVVAAWQENTDWTLELPSGWKPWVLLKDVDFPNEGREASTFLHAMQILYNNPPKLVAFVQGNPFDHCPDLFDRLQRPCAEFTWLPEANHGSDQHGSPNHTGLPVGDLCEAWTGSRFDGHVMFAAGGQFMLPGKLLKKNPVDVYQTMEESVKMGEHAWVAERLWERVLA